MTGQLGRKAAHCYNILTVGIVHEGVAIPVLWWMLPKKGNSNSDERMRFLEEMLKFFPDAQIRCLCADREFVGQAWLRYLLLEPSLPFRIRIRATDKIKRGGKTLAAKVVFAHLARGESQQLQGDCRVWGYQVSVEALRLDDGDFLVVIAPPIRSVSFATTLYAGGLKLFLGFSRLVGFVWNPPTLLTPSACGLLFALLTLALVWSLKTGLWLHQLHPIPLKKHGRRAKSLFRLGFDHLRHLILNPSLPNYRDFLHSLEFLSCT